MYGSLLRVRAEDVDWIRANPREFAFDFLHYERPTPKAGGIVGWLKRLSPITITGTSEQEPAPPASGRSPVEDLDLEKSWHALHFLFTGKAEGGLEPMAFMLIGGEDVGEDGWGDPVARLFSPAEVEKIDAFLSALTADSLASRYDPERMTTLEIYPGGWDADAFEHLEESFEDLRRFVRGAVDAGDWVIVHVA
jgi:hypothetical protein